MSRPEYVQRLRQKIGTEQVLIPATAIVIVNERDEVLLHLRGESKEWGLPGGLMDTGETAEESARRETREETGLAVRCLKIYGVFSGPDFETQYPNGDRTAPVILGFVADGYEGAITTSPEAPEVVFFPLSALPQPMNRYHKRFVEGFLRYRRQGGAVPVLE